MSTKERHKSFLTSCSGDKVEQVPARPEVNGCRRLREDRLRQQVLQLELTFLEPRTDDSLAILQRRVRASAQLPAHKWIYQYGRLESCEKAFAVPHHKLLLPRGLHDVRLRRRRVGQGPTHETFSRYNRQSYSNLRCPRDSFFLHLGGCCLLTCCDGHRSASWRTRLYTTGLRIGARWGDVPGDGTFGRSHCLLLRSLWVRDCIHFKLPEV